jgi:hypothetical protein
VQRQQPRERGIIWLNVFILRWYPRRSGLGQDGVEQAVNALSDHCAPSGGHVRL